MTLPPLTIPSSITTVVNLSPVSKDASGKDEGTLPADLVSDRQKEIERLAGLPRLKYAEQRKAAARDLGIGISGLDEAVREERRSAGGQGKPLVLPEVKPWETPVTGQELLPQLITTLRRHVVMSDHETIATALWVIHCHAFTAFNITPRLAITSPEKGCGKTTLLDLLGMLVPRRISTANVGAAAVFRMIEMTQPTLLIDEADTFLRSNDELRGILNSGHRKGGSTVRCVGENHEPREFSTWAPAAIAMIGRPPDTLEDRSISVRLRRRRPDEDVVRLRIDRAEDIDEVARKVSRWVKDKISALSSADDPEMPAILSNRALDNWRPLIVIADLIGGEWPDKARRVAEAMAAIASTDEQSAGPMLLGDIKNIFERQDTDRLSSEELLNGLLGLEDRPWPEWKNGKAMTKATLARQLSRFGINTENVRIDTKILKGYLLHRFKDAFSRYLPPESATSLQTNNDGHFSQDGTATQVEPVAHSKCEKPLRDSGCSEVAVCEPLQEGEASDEPVCAHCGGAGELLECSISGETRLLHRDCIDDTD